MKMFSLSMERQKLPKSLNYQSMICTYVHVPEGSVTQTTKMYVRAVLTGDFKLPPGCHQVSGIYQIECSEKLDKDVTLKLGHYVVVDSQDEYADFSFCEE